MQSSGSVACGYSAHRGQGSERGETLLRSEVQPISGAKQGAQGAARKRRKSREQLAHKDFCASLNPNYTLPVPSRGSSPSA